MFFNKRIKNKKILKQKDLQKTKKIEVLEKFNHLLLTIYFYTTYIIIITSVIK